MDANDDFIIAKRIVFDKIYNQMKLLARIDGDPTIISRCLDKVDDVNDPETLLGIEGTASKDFFRQFFADFNWARRAPRTKEDIVNFMLDIGYTVLFNMVDAVARHFGLDTYKGVYHKQFFNRRSLVCDLMEPFRCMIDNRTRTAISLGIINSSTFKLDNNLMTTTDWETSRKIVGLYAETVIEQRVEILQYVQTFYRHIMNPKNKLGKFRLER
jgi:CRISPR-associated endonuclease Cas1